MIDLRTVLIDIRQSMLNIHDGFPAEKNSPDFIAACQKIVEHGWDDKFNGDGRFDFLNRLFKQNPFTRYFTRLCLLKLIFDETLVVPNLVHNKNWFRIMRDNFEAEFKLLITNRQIAAGNPPPPGIERYITPAKWASMTGCVTSATFFKALARQYAPKAWEPLAEKMLSGLALLMLTSFLVFMVLESTYRTPAVSDVALELSRQQALKDLRNNPQFKELVLISDDDLNKLGVEKSSPQPH